MKNTLILFLVSMLAGCAGNGINPLAGLRGADQAPVADPAVETPAPEGGEIVDPNPTDVVQPPASAVAPAENAATPEQFDTTTPEDRSAALDTAAEPASDGRLGTTVASIGDPGEPGFWIKTPLVSARQPGRIYYASTGRSVQVQLIPSGGAAGSGSQVSLAAMRLLGAPLTGLPEIVVYTN